MGVIYITMLGEGVYILSVFCFRTTQRGKKVAGGSVAIPPGGTLFYLLLCPAVAVWIVSASRGAAPVIHSDRRGAFKISCKNMLNCEYVAKYLFNGVLNTISCGA